MGKVAQIIYGHGGHLGNFEILARSLAASLIPKYGRRNVLSQHIERRDAFFDYLANPPFAFRDQIAELHVFSHSIGGGIFIAYGDRNVEMIREVAFKRADSAGRRIRYEEVLNAEIGAVLTDDFIRAPYVRLRTAIQNNFDPAATVKLWGCNSGIPRWVYSDVNDVTDPKDDTVAYYWRALNERNIPKPAVAQAFADYFDRPCYGASSGSHIEVRYNGAWESSSQYKKEVGRWPSGAR
jgi:hypothetical protein